MGGGAVLAVVLEDGAVVDGQDVEFDCYEALLAQGESPGVLRTQGWTLVVTPSSR
ncbi:hypothetical protein [Streptomyces sp. NPDC018000]|uniref:hypothetical protein n=1 Tax=Streptomyces sp. NPDC018000 TaxID=3365028 RepID=UPI0037B2FB8C